MIQIRNINDRAQKTEAINASYLSRQLAKNETSRGEGLDDSEAEFGFDSSSSEEKTVGRPRHKNKATVCNRTNRMELLIGNSEHEA